MTEPEPQFSASMAGTLLDGYRPDAGIYDEMCLAPGVIRPHWQGLISSLESMGRERLGRHYQEVQRQLQENGVTYNAYQGGREAQRPWTVDPIPLLIEGQEWAAMEQGVAQRVRLLDLLLADLYGPRTAFRQGVLPPELIYAHPGFLRPCYQSLPADRRWLTFHRVDLARSPDGRFWALGDHAGAPSGAGYALENRIILARVLPFLYRDAPIRRLAGFLETMRATLTGLALRNREHPHVVLLTPGPDDKTYFEHAYLANYLSITLAAGEDLLVRDGLVWLKTLGGLRPVDVILRRVPDHDCDPLELRGDSLLGPAGLLQAVRGKGVVVANALGSSIVENPALAAFLPGLCRHFLGEDLRLPSVATWWCGGVSEREYVIANLDRLVIDCILPGHNAQMGALLDQAARAELISRIRATPHLFVGRESVILSTAPVLEDGRLVPRQLVLRGFAVADDGDYRVMPGGLARVFPALDSSESAARQGGISKDVWVLAATPQQHVGRLHQTHGPVVITRDGGDLPSRVAENLYWLGRYGERLDGTSRLLREALIRLMEQERDDTEEHCLEDLLAALKLDLPPVASPHARFLAIRGVLHGLITDPAHGEGLPAIFAGMFRTGRAVRDHLGDDDWRILNRLQQHLQDIPGGLSTGSARELLEGNLTLLAAFYGLCNETMPHHYGWLFLDIGRYLERVQHTLALLKLAFVTALRPGMWLWEVVLTSTDNLTAYQRRYRSELHPTAILDLLLFDEGNPRAVGYQLRRLQTQIDRLPHQRSTPYRSAEERLILEAVSILQLADIERLATLERSSEAAAELAQLLEALQRPLSRLSNALIHSHFSHAEALRQLVRTQA